MAISYTVTIPQLRKLQAAFRKAPELTAQSTVRAIDKSLVMLQANAKFNAPVDSGLLRRSINVRPAQRHGSTIEGSVGTLLRYAIPQEVGTGIYAGNGYIYPKRAKVLAWKRGGKWHFARRVRGVKGRFYFKKSLSQSRGAIRTFFQTALDEVTQQLGD